MKFSWFILFPTFKLSFFFVRLLSQSECCSKLKSFCQIAQMSGLTGFCACVCVCASGYSRIAVLQHQLPVLEILTDLCHLSLNPAGGKLSLPWVSVGAQPEHHQFTLASGDVQGLSKLRSMANVWRNCIPVAESHCVFSSVFKQPIQISVLDSRLGNHLGTYVALPPWIRPCLGEGCASEKNFGRLPCRCVLLFSLIPHTWTQLY